MKKAASVLLILILVLSLAVGCTGGGEATNGNGSPDPGEPGDPVTLEFWIYSEFYDGPNSPLQAVINEFEAEHNVSVEVIPTAYGSSSYRDPFIQAASGGVGPDLILSDNIWVPQLAAMELIIPLDEYFHNENEFFAGPVDAGKFMDSVYGVPFHIDVMVLFYNVDRFIEVGLDPDSPPATWEDFREYANLLTDPASGKYGFGLLGGWGGSFEWLPWLWQNGGEILSEDGTSAAFNSPEGIESMEFFTSILLDEGVVPEAAMSWRGWDELTSGFATGTVAMVQGMNVMLNQLDNLDQDFQWNVAPLPSRKTSAATLGGGHLVISRNSEHPELAYALIEKITGDALHGMMDGYMRISARLDAAEKQAFLRENETAMVFYEALEHARPRPTIPEWTTIDYDTIQPAMMRILFEGADVTTEMNRAADIVDTEVLQY